MKKSHKNFFARAARLLPVLTALLLRGPVAGAQSSEPFNPFSAFKASAETWAMSKYGDAKPSLYTGAMHFSVPIYTYQDPDFTLPVSLEYNFDGYRPSQHSGTVGLGWNLNCGGVITRDIRGFPDDDAVAGGADRGYVGYYRTVEDGNGFVSDTLGNNVFWSIYCNTIYTQTPSLEAAHGINPFTHIPVYVYTTFPAGVPKPTGPVNYDITPDIYHFSIPGHSGDFMFMPDGSVRVFNSDLPHGEVKVEFAPFGSGNRTPTSTYYCTFRITTGDGTEYEFGGGRSAIDYSKSTSTLSNPNMPSISATAFHLNKITAPNGRTMKFRYSSDKQVSVAGSRSYTPLYHDGSYHNDSRQVNTKTFSYFSVPEEVLVDGDTLVVFGYEYKTLNECDPAYFDDEPNSAQPVILDYVNISSPKRLSSITVYNADKDIVESAGLVQSFASSGTPKMFLDYVSTLKGGKHTFEYDRNRAFPKNDRQETDHWGFWNGRYLSDIRTIVRFDGSRYNQMTGLQKEAAAAYARAGAMTRIDYPAGGNTEIEYEGHVAEKGLDEEAVIYPSEGTTSITVGGVRVKKLINQDSQSSRSDTTSFSYSGGFLYKMPRYLFVFPMSYSTASGGSVGGFTFNTVITGYNADCDFSVSRDETIGYKNVIQIHPDYSRTETVFSVYEPGYSDEYLDSSTGLFPYTYLPKRGVLSDYDYINDQVALGTAPNITLPHTDRRNMRGRILSETTKDAAGNNVRETLCVYSADTVHLNQVWWNDLDQFDCTPWTCASPLLERETVTDYADDGTAQTTVKMLAYNAAGQVSSERICSPQCPSDTVNTYYAYYHETQEPYSFRALPGALRYAVSTKSTGGTEYIVASEWRNYAAESVHTQPSEIISYKFGMYPVGGEAHARVVYDLGVAEHTTFTRDTLFRITRADMPGGAWVEYDWDGNDIIRVRQNDSGNQMQYSWKSLVGVTEITAPSGQKESVDYDGRNRLWRRKDTAGRIRESYQYKLKNE